MNDIEWNKLIVSQNRDILGLDTVVLTREEFEDIFSKMEFDIRLEYSTENDILEEQYNSLDMEHENLKEQYDKLREKYINVKYVKIGSL